MNTLTSHPQRFVYGQLLGLPGFTIVARTPNITPSEAKEVRDSIVLQLTTALTELPTHAFGTVPQTDYVFSCNYRNSSQRQVGRQYFTEEGYAVADYEVFAQYGYKFWALFAPSHSTTTEVVMLDLESFTKTLLTDDAAFIRNKIDANRSRIFHIINQILSTEEAVIVQSENAEDALDLLKIIHLLFPRAVRQHLSFSIGAPCKSAAYFRLCFVPTVASQQSDTSQRWQTISQSVIPDYAEQIKLYIECYSGEHIADLLDAICANDLHFRGSWQSLASYLSKELWAIIGVGVATAMLKSGKNLDVEHIISALHSEHGSRADRVELLSHVTSELVSRVTRGQDIQYELTRFADCIVARPINRQVSYEALTTLWNTAFLIVPQLCDILISGYGFSDTSTWRSFILPLMSKAADNKHSLDYAMNWIRAGDITAEQFFELFAQKCPPEFYLEVFNLVNDSIISDNPQSLRDYAKQYRSLRMLYTVLSSSTALETSVMSNSQGDIHMLRETPAIYEGVVLLLMRIAENLPFEELVRVLRVLHILICVPHSNSNISEKAQKAFLQSMCKVSNFHNDPEIAASLVALANCVGVDSERAMNKLSNTAQLRRYVDLIRDDFPLRKLYSKEIGVLIVSPDTSLESLSDYDLDILSRIMSDYNKVKARQRLDIHWAARKVRQYALNPDQIIQDWVKARIEEVLARVHFDVFLHELEAIEILNINTKIATFQRSHVSVHAQIEAVQEILTSIGIHWQRLEGYLEAAPNQLPCPICGRSLPVTEQQAMCRKCGRSYHQQCWREANFRCVIRGCAETTRHWFNIRRLFDKKWKNNK